MKRLIVLLSLFAVSLALAACTSSAAPAGPLQAVKVDQASLDSTADYWADAPLLAVTTQSAKAAVGKDDDESGEVDVRLQAAYDDQNLVIRAEWEDPSQSIFKNSWTWDGNMFTKSKENEDRIMFIFPMDSNPGFANKGCAEACHSDADDEDEWWMGSESEDVRYDLWQWQSARTHFAGQADDEWLANLTDPEKMNSSRHHDASDGGGAADNGNETKDGPATMSGVDLSHPFILAGQEVPLDTAALTAGDIVPGYIWSAFDGSRGDVTAAATYADGKWTVVLMRPLDTGHDDDVIFVPPRPVPFGVSVVDDGAGLDHTTPAEVLTLEWQ